MYPEKWNQYTHTYIYIIDSSMPWHGGKRLYSPPSKFYFYFIFWLTKRTAIKFHSFFPPLHFFFFFHLAKIPLRCFSPPFSLGIVFEPRKPREPHRCNQQFRSQLYRRHGPIVNETNWIGLVSRFISSRFFSPALDGRVTVWCNRPKYSKRFSEPG